MNKPYLVIIILVVLAGVLFWRSRLPPKSTAPSSLPLPQSDGGYFKLLLDYTVSGGPPKDGIPAIDRPKFESASAADEWLLPNDVVFGVVGKEGARAYPQRILVWHEIVNDEIDGEKTSVTYCPLTGTAIGFQARPQPEITSTFGVSGKLVNSNLIMYDRLSDSRWPQILGQAISGPLQGVRLKEFPVIWTTWERFKKIYPDTRVLSRETGFIRNYDIGGDPYGSYLDGTGYYTSDLVIFPAVFRDARLSPKAVVVGLRDEKRQAVAVLKDTLRRQKNMKVMLGERPVVLNYDEALDFYAAAYKDTGEPINAFDAMWFSWYAFYPNTALVR